MLAPVVGVACGATAAAARLGRRVGPARGWRSPAGSAMFANAASNAWNQAFDADIDRVNKPARPIPSGRATVRGALTLGHVCAALGLLLACAPCEARGPPVVPRVRRHRRARDLDLQRAAAAHEAQPGRRAGDDRGPARVPRPRGRAGPSLAAPTTIEPWALGLVPGLFVLGAASTKDFADVEGDRAHGCRTLPVALGAARAARVVAPFLVLPFLLYPVLSAAGLLARPFAAWLVTGALLAAGGGWTARALLADPARLATERNHPAWRGMYLLMVANTVSIAAVYALT